MQQANTPNSSNPDFEAEQSNVLCVDPEHPEYACPICDGKGVITYNVPIHDTRFGKLFRCPNNPVESDDGRRERIRHLSNLSAFSDKTFANFETEPDGYSDSEKSSLRASLIRVERYANRPQGWLLMEGTYGCGKSHLAAAIGNIRLNKGDLVLFITTPDLLDHLRSAFSPHSGNNL